MQGVLVIDDTGDRKDGTATAHVARQYLGSVGKVDNGIVAVTSLWADERIYYPLHVGPTPRPPAAGRRAGSRVPDQAAAGRGAGPGGREAGIPFRAVVADCFYGDNPASPRRCGAAKVPFVLALKPRKGTWAPAEQAHTPVEAASELGWRGPSRPGRWRRVMRRFRDGHAETWWAAERSLAARARTGGCGWWWPPPTRPRCPGHSTWYLLTNLPRPASRRAQPADLAEVVRLYGLRNWVEQGYKQVKGELGWADFQVRTDRAIRRHWALVCCAFSFCWQAFLAEQPAQPAAPSPQAAPAAARGAQATGHPGGTGRARRRGRGRCGRCGPG